MRNILILTILFLTGCQYFQPKEETQETVIARVGEKQLLATNLVDLIPSNLTPMDSAIFVEKFVLDWVKKQLLITKAEKP